VFVQAIGNRTGEGVIENMKQELVLLLLKEEAYVYEEEVKATTEELAIAACWLRESLLPEAQHHVLEYVHVLLSA
jgi:hypothetical protein